MRSIHQDCLLLIVAGALLGACTVMPTGPSVMALPGSNKAPDVYQGDVAACQQYAGSITAANSGTAAVADNNAAATAAASTALGAATGAIIGAASGQAGQGAAIGAGFGLLFGGMAGSSYSAMSSYQLQRGYDSAYLQCMYARGNRVPMPRSYARAPYRPDYSYPREPGPGYPPPGTAPPPGVPGSGYRPPANMPPSSYPPPDAPPPPNLPSQP
jgi:hypothetical protein